MALDGITFQMRSRLPFRKGEEKCREETGPGPLAKVRPQAGAGDVAAEDRAARERVVARARVLAWVWDRAANVALAAEKTNRVNPS